MDAGVLAFRLCDRGFDCDHCPLDAAIRHDPRTGRAAGAIPAPLPPCTEWVFPADRVYTPCHVWVQAVHGGRVRTGIDACAARLLRGLQGVRRPSTQTVPRGARFCTLGLDGGEVHLAAPLSCVVQRWNGVLDDTPGALASDPYTSGWLAEIEPLKTEEMDDFCAAGEAKECAERDMRQFRRRIAFRLMSSEPTEPNAGGTFVDAARRLVGPDPFLAVAREMLQ
jgi:glycine cleavage system H lipoate-binding protein